MKRRKPYTEMNTRELEEATREFDKEFVADHARPLNPAERRMHRKAAKRGRGRPRVGKGAVRVDITLERDLLSRADALASSRKIGRSEMVALALEQLLRRAG